MSDTQNNEAAGERARTPDPAQQVDGQRPECPTARGSGDTLRTRAYHRWTRASLRLVGAAAVAVALGCSPQPFATAATIAERSYAVSPESLRVESGLVLGEIIRMKVTERVDTDSGRVTSPARLTGRLFLENTSKDQAVRLIGGRILYLDAKGEPIALEDGRAEPTIKLGSAYGATGRLDPGKSATELLYAEFPAAALGSDRLKVIQVQLVFSAIPTISYEESLNFKVSVGTR